jgi:hypothetical protein
MTVRNGAVRPEKVLVVADVPDDKCRVALVLVAGPSVILKTTPSALYVHRITRNGPSHFVEFGISTHSLFY